MYSLLNSRYMSTYFIIIINGLVKINAYFFENDASQYQKFLINQY